MTTVKELSDSLYAGACLRLNLLEDGIAELLLDFVRMARSSTSLTRRCWANLMRL